MPNNTELIQTYYSPDDLFNKIKSALMDSGRGLDHLTVDDLEPVDEFHIRGLTATRELIRCSEFDAEIHILDVGCGVGGSARRLAQEVGCNVTGVDLSDRYISTAHALTELLGMQNQVKFAASDARDLPFESQLFDGIWSIQMGMNINDKTSWLVELYRVLKPGCKLVLYEVCGTAKTPIYFPVPWAQNTAMSFLVPQEEFKQLVQSAGLKVQVWQDKTELAYQAFSQIPEPSGESNLPTLGVHLLVGADILTKAYNLRRNLAQERVRLIQAVVQKPN